jgi:hypothetical protein
VQLACRDHERIVASAPITDAGPLGSARLLLSMSWTSFPMKAKYLGLSGFEKAHADVDPSARQPAI